jgi:hypothetical protein
MKSQKSTKQSLERIFEIKWHANFSLAELHLSLIEEYFRRASLWREKINCDNKWPFFDISLHIDSSIRAERQSIDDLKQHLSELQLSDIFAVKICEWYLHWIALEHSYSLEKFNLLPPYEPLIVMYEQGGLLFPEHNGLSISGAVVWPHKWLDYLDVQPFHSPLLES